MYRVNVLSAGKYGNIVPGYRYSLFKREIAQFIAQLDELESEYKVEKFICCSGLWCWSEDNIFNADIFG